MYDNKVHSLEYRIVSISQPWLRPIVRGKVKAPVEFGAKFDLSLDAELNCHIFLFHLQQYIFYSLQSTPKFYYTILILRQNIFFSKALLQLFKFCRFIFSEIFHITMHFHGLFSHLHNTHDNMRTMCCNSLTACNNVR